MDMRDCFLMEQPPCDAFRLEEYAGSFDFGKEYLVTYTGDSPVRSVNGKMGDVQLDAADVGALPDTYTPPVTKVNNKTGDVELDKTDVGLGNVADVLQYSANNPPPYPVTSVNGQTGAVSIETGGSPTLLWTNPHPTSVFAEQTIQLDLSEYSFVIVEYGHDYGFVTGAAIFPVPTITPSQGYSAYNEIQGIKWTGSQCALYLRRLKITTSSIWFGDGTRFTTYNTSGSTTTDNNVGFPKRIWGVK